MCRGRKRSPRFDDRCIAEYTAGSARGPRDPVRYPRCQPNSSVSRFAITLSLFAILYMKMNAPLRALANPKRLQILEWLKAPRKHFPPQVFGDLVSDGVCGVFIAAKLRVSQPTASEHLRVLSHAGLIRGKRIRKWTFYRRNEPRIRQIKRVIATTL